MAIWLLAIPALVGLSLIPGCTKLDPAPDPKSKNNPKIDPLASPSAKKGPKTSDKLPGLPTPEEIQKGCTLTRDEFVRNLADPKKHMVVRSRLNQCFANSKDQQAVILEAGELDGNLEDYSLVERAIYKTLNETYTYKIPANTPSGFSSILFRPDLPLFVGEMKKNYQKLQHQDRLQYILVKFDLGHLWKKEGVKEPQAEAIQEAVLEKIHDIYKTENHRALPRLTISTTPPPRETPHTTILITDRSLHELLREKPERARGLNSDFMAIPPALRASFLAKDACLKIFRERHQVPAEVPDEGLLDFGIKQGFFGNEDDNLISGHDLEEGRGAFTLKMGDPFELEFSNPHLEGEIFVYANNLRRIHRDSDLNALALRLGIIASHELGHALGLEHYFGESNLMSSTSELQGKTARFLDWQKAYLKALFGD